MKRISATLPVALAFVVGCVAASSGFLVPPAQAEATPRYEYICHAMNFDMTEGELTGFLNKHGAEGWRLQHVGINAAVLCFERPVGG